MTKLKIVLSSMWYPLTMAGYFWRALKRREDVDLFVTGPFSDDYIPWNGGMKLPREYVIQPDYPLPPSAGNMRLPASFVQSVLPWKPDLWLQVDAGWRLSTKPDAGIVGHVLTDPHVLRDQYNAVTYADKVWCMQTPYMNPGEIYLPYGYDPEFHHPMEVEKLYDACLVGLHYPQRDALVQRLRSRGMTVYYSLGEIYNQYQMRYNESRIALSWSSLHDLPARVWEGMAMGLPVVTNRVPDLTVNGFEDGVHYLGFDTLDEAEAQVMRLMVDPVVRNRVSRAGYKAVKDCSWDDRVQKILLDCGLINGR